MEQISMLKIKKGRTPLHLASGGDNEESTKLLLENGANKEAKEG